MSGDARQPPPQFETLAPVSVSRHTVGLVVGLLTWYVALLVGVWVYLSYSIMQFAIGVALVSFLFSMGALLLARRARLREVDRVH